VLVPGVPVVRVHGVFPVPPVPQGVLVHQVR
jgi:hypothetical protein